MIAKICVGFNTQYKGCLLKINYHQKVCYFRENTGKSDVKDRIL
jgi:hypothetical protein